MVFVALGALALAGALTAAVFIDRRQRNGELQARTSAACSRVESSVDRLAGPGTRDIFGEDGPRLRSALGSMTEARCEALMAQLTPYGSTDATFDAPAIPAEQVRAVNAIFDRIRERCLSRTRATAEAFELHDERRAELEQACEMGGARLRERPRPQTLSAAVRSLEARVNLLDPAEDGPNADQSP